MANTVYLSLGTNLGRRQKNLQNAVDALGEIAAVEAISPVYETAPWGVEEQPDFLNICLKAKTLLDPEALLSSCKAIEQNLGRVPGEKWGPRLIDIDIIFYNDWLIDRTNIAVPHPQLEQRAFVLAPLLDIAPQLVEPRNGVPVGQLVESLDLSTVRRLDSPERMLKKPAGFAWGVKTYVMGIINVTPDSFSGDGLYGNSEHLARIVELGTTFASQGADVLDVGGESTRPGSIPVQADEELRRVLPAIEALYKSVDIPLSIDTYKANVAAAALEAGASWINDVWGMRMDPEMAAVAASAGCPVVLMHNRSKPKDVMQEERLGGRYVGVDYQNLIPDINQELDDLIESAAKAGVAREQIIIDPGIGFGKTVAQNLRILDELDRFRNLGFPIMVGPSRKSFIGYSLKLPPDERVEGTAAAVAIAIDRGADIVRVHDVATMARVAAMTDLIVRS